MARRKNPFDPSDMIDMMFEQQKLASAAMEVIWYRSCQMALGSMTPVENASMWMEKPTAIIAGMEKATIAAVAGKSPHQVMKAALAPMTTKASSNAKRLRG